MNTKDTIRAALNLSDLVVKSYVGDLSDAELLHRPGPGCNHVAWQLGHLIVSDAGLLDMVQPGSSPELPAGFAEKHAKENATSDQPTDFCTKQEYLELTDKVNAAALKLLEEFPDARFDEPAPERFRSICPTLGAVFVLIATHPMMHAGQFVPVRRALGKPIVI